ncbi:MAG: GtrA family protein [Deltaproteobacteria bacterium]|nr:MAG: GtrA family protein [Deltaproteobacteria bacterium]
MPQPPKPDRRTFSRSALVGVVATLVDVLALSILVDVLGVEPAVANLPALSLGLAVQFFGNKYFAFNDRSRDFLRQGALFGVVEVGAFALNLVAFHLLAVTAGLPVQLARLIGSAAVYFGFSYPLWGRIFRADAA